MRTNLKISLTVLLCAFLSLTLLYLVNEWYRDQYDPNKWEDNFYSQDFDPNKKKLFIFGSSLVARINHTYVEDYLLRHDQNYDVYNLARQLDLPERRIKHLENIISSKPDLVVYGIGFRDLLRDGNPEPIAPGVIPSAQFDKSQWNPLSLVFPYDDFFIRNIPVIDFENLKNPKFVSLKILEMQLEGEPAMVAKYFHPKHPFTGQGSQPILTEEQMEYKYRNIEGKVLLDPNGQNALALKKIVSELKKNDIEVMILVVPHHRIYLDLIPDEDMELFFSLKKELSDEYGVKIIDMHNKYSDLKVWNDFAHIDFNVNSTIYYDDISREILEGVSTIDNNKNMKRN